MKNATNTGYSAGNNVGLNYLVREAGCDLVFITNPDTLFEESAIIAMRDQVAGCDEIALIACKRYGHESEEIY
mgnify:CR=1 FL=1